MRRFIIHCGSMTATYRVGEFYANNLHDAIKQARGKVMPDQRGWHFYEVDDN